MKRSILWTLVLALPAIMVLGIGYYLFLVRGAQDQVAEQLLNRQRILARAEVSNITTFFERFGDGVATLAQTTSIERGDANALEDLDTFMEQRKDTGIIGGVILTDKNGVVQFNSNVLGTRDVGESLSDRQFFAWASSEATKGEYYISRPIVGRLGASKDQTIVVVASPVIRDTKFSGVIASSVKLQPLVERFFGLMKLSDNTQIYVVGESGEIIYTNSDSQNGYQTFKDKLKSGLSSHQGGQFTTDEYLVAYSPLTLGVQKWLVVISSPADEVLEQTQPYHIRQAAMFTITALIIFLLAVFVGRKSEVQ